MLPIYPEQVASWGRRDDAGIEPVTLALPDWQATTIGMRGLPNERIWVYQRRESMITLVRIWDFPMTPGNPMAITSSRVVSIPNRPTFTVDKTGQHDCFPRQVDVVFLKRATWQVRLEFDHCSEAEVDQALATLVFNDDLQ
jgi:hypothetical protein